MTLTGKEIQNMTTTEGTGIISRKDGRACLEYAGVYGIYDGDDLLYIGSATCLIERWKEHNQNFRTKSFSSKLYSAEVDPDQLIYKELISGTEIAQTCGLAYTSTWLLEFAEWMYIRTMQPKYNINGKTKQFQFHPNVKKSEELISHLEDGCNVERTTAQPRSTERTTTPQSKQSTSKTSQPKQSLSTDSNDLLQYCLASATEVPNLPPLSPNLLAQSDQKLAFLPSVRRPKRTISFPLYEETKKRYFSMNLLANQNENNFSVSPDDIDLIRVNVIDPYVLFQTENSPYYLSTETFFVWQLICEHLAKQDKYTASIPASWLTKAQLKELVSRQYLTPDSGMTLQLNRNYIIKQLSLKEAKEQYPQQYERSI